MFDCAVEIIYTLAAFWNANPSHSSSRIFSVLLARAVEFIELSLMLRLVLTQFAVTLCVAAVAGLIGGGNAMLRIAEWLVRTAHCQQRPQPRSLNPDDVYVWGIYQDCHDGCHACCNCLVVS